MIDHLYIPPPGYFCFAAHCHCQSLLLILWLLLIICACRRTILTLHIGFIVIIFLVSWVICQVVPYRLQEPFVLVVLRFRRIADNTCCQCYVPSGLEKGPMASCDLLGGRRRLDHDPLGGFVAHLICKHLHQGALIGRQVFGHIHPELHFEVSGSATAAA